MHYCSILGPSSPPTNFLVSSVSPYTLSFFWNPPPEETQNGVITSYTLSCQPEQALPSLPVTYTAAGTYVISGFSAATLYNCSVFAATAGGSGPPALQMITTDDDSNYSLSHSLKFNNIFHFICSPRTCCWIKLH